MSDGKRSPYQKPTETLSIMALQQALRADTTLNQPDSDYLQSLQLRLGRVQSWGGAFAKISLSPDMELLLKRTATQAKTKIATAY